MTPRNYLYLLQNYERYQEQIERLIMSIMTAQAKPVGLPNVSTLESSIEQMQQSYPFVELLYYVDEQGVQVTESAIAKNVKDAKKREAGIGSDRSNRPYYKAALNNKNSATVTDPYLSTATHQLAISGVRRFTQSDGAAHYLVLNINLEQLIAFLNGDSLRNLVHPVFQVIYALIGVMLVVVSMVLLFAAGQSLFEMLLENTKTANQAFHSVILITLGLAIFDLGKTILEEEVLLHKDIHHSGSTRRTISRFMSAIVIAVSIESLLLMFKSLLGDATYLNSAVFMLFAAVALLVGLGVYLKLTNDEGDKTS